VDDWFCKSAQLITASTDTFNSSRVRSLVTVRAREELKWRLKGRRFMRCAPLVSAAIMGGK